MPLVASFTATESMADPGTITFTDNSTGSDGTITSRRIYIRLSNGNWVDSNGDESSTITYITWAYASSSTTLELFSQSTAPDIEVLWMAGSTETYSSEDTFCFNFFDYEFALELIQGQTSNPGIIQDTTYLTNFYTYILNMFCEETAIDPGEDIYSSQQAMNKNYLMSSNEGLYF